jgi:hypothetical protein
MSLQTVESKTSNVVLVGDLKWVADTLRAGCMTIAVLDPDEQFPRTEKGFRPLRGVTLTKSATKIFAEELGETIFVEDRIAIAIRTEDLLADLDAGRGTKGNPYLIGTAVKLTRSMPITTLASKAANKQNL